MPNPKYTGYRAADPYFNLVREAVGETVDGDHFFDIVSDDVVYEVLYGDNIELQSADNLTSHTTDDGRVLIIEYEVHGTILATGVKYDNRFCSIIEIEHRKIAHWRDYMDSLAAWHALTA